MVKLDLKPNSFVDLLAQDPHARGVERADPHDLRAAADQLLDPLAHLGGRLVGEGDRQDRAGVGVALGDQPRDPAGEHPGLARPRAGDDQQRRSLVDDRLALRLVEPLEQLLAVGRRRSSRASADPDPASSGESARRGGRGWGTACSSSVPTPSRRQRTASVARAATEGPRQVTACSDSSRPAARRAAERRPGSKRPPGRRQRPGGRRARAASSRTHSAGADQSWKARSKVAQWIGSSTPPPSSRWARTASAGSRCTSGQRASYAPIGSMVRSKGPCRSPIPANAGCSRCRRRRRPAARRPRAPSDAQRVWLLPRLRPEKCRASVQVRVSPPTRGRLVPVELDDALRPGPPSGAGARRCPAGPRSGAGHCRSRTRASMVAVSRWS